ncbi:MAG: hypothetical protein IK016_11160 [Lachnospiraceae bacterium]|nr:hypothetical protein [Lachnospiraceae bacterium]
MKDILYGFIGIIAALAIFAGGVLVGAGYLNPARINDMGEDSAEGTTDDTAVIDLTYHSSAAPSAETVPVYEVAQHLSYTQSDPAESASVADETASHGTQSIPHTSQTTATESMQVSIDTEYNNSTQSSSVTAQPINTSQVTSFSQEDISQSKAVTDTERLMKLNQFVEYIARPRMDDSIFYSIQIPSDDEVVFYMKIPQFWATEQQKATHSAEQIALFNQTLLDSWTALKEELITQNRELSIAMSENISSGCYCSFIVVNENNHDDVFLIVSNGAVLYDSLVNTGIDPYALYNTRHTSYFFKN